jgi:hypothetical protein
MGTLMPQHLSGLSNLLRSPGNASPRFESAARERCTPSHG